MNKTLLIGLGVVGAGAALYVLGAFDQVDQTLGLGLDPADELSQGPSTVDQALTYLDPSSWDLTSYLDASDPMQNANVQAFLKVIRYAEGTAGPGGYTTIFRTAGGPNTFENFADHPRVAKQFTSQGKTLWTSAAGAYQLMAVSPRPGLTPTRIDTWDRLKAKLGLPDFSPDSQDRAAIALIDQSGALADVKAGRFDSAISKCKGTWASLPGATYGQPTKGLADLRNVYAQAGGTITTA